MMEMPHCWTSCIHCDKDVRLKQHATKSKTKYPVRTCNIMGTDQSEDALICELANMLLEDDGPVKPKHIECVF